ncbi:hypothetical protein [Streptomyces macrosporus]|uniref:Secreted protein n=1 Tax=Streptomyces macrosporus TaxID=44032 RepID=A0ABN3KBI8_9ACTN
MNIPTPPPPQQPGRFGPPNPHPYGPVPPPNTRQAARRKALITHGAVAFAALLVGAVMGGGDEAGATDTPAKAGPRPTVTVTATETAEADPAPTVTETVTAEPKKAEPKKTEKPEPATGFSGTGEYLVGEDIAPGTYKTEGPEDEWGCYWERAKDSSGEFDSIITNNNLQGPGRVTVAKGEVFKTNGCLEWKKAG